MNKTTPLSLRLWMAVLLCSLISFPAFGQREITGIQFEKLGETGSSARWIPLKDEFRIAPAQFVESYRDLLGLGPNDELRLKRSQPSSIPDYRYDTYVQWHNGVRIPNATLVLHVKEGKVQLLNGDLVPGLELQEKGMITEEEALQSAIKHVGAVRYLWQGLPLEKPEEEHSFWLNYPEGEKMIVSSSIRDIVNPDLMHVAYKFPIGSAEPAAIQYVYVDIFSGEVILTEEGGQQCNWGNVNTMFNGNRTFYTNRTWEPFWTHYRLKDKCSNRDIVTKRYSNSNHKDSDNTWGTPGGPHEGATLHWAGYRAWRYYDNVHNHDGLNGNGSDVDLFTSSSLFPGGIAFHTNGEIHIENAPGAFNFGCNPITINSLASIDIIGHEFTHGVINEGGNLNQGNPGESGALGEGFGDIFGVMIERDAVGALDWTIGDDTSPDPEFQRSLANPNNFGVHINGFCLDLGTPDEFGQAGFWDPGLEEHIASGPLAHWFWLIANGGTHRNGDVVTSIGITNARRVAFDCMLALAANGDYQDARNISLNFAANTWGVCSWQHAEIWRAWNAVRVNNTPLPTPSSNVNITGAAGICVNATQTYTATFIQSANYTWTTGSSLQVVSSAGNTAQIKRISGSTSNSWITVTATTNCDQGTDTHTVGLGGGSSPPTPSITAPFGTICQYTITNTFNISSPVSGVTYTWSTSPNAGIIPLNGNGTSVWIEPWSSGTMTVYATPNNACGAGTAGSRSVYITSHSSPSCSGNPLKLAHEADGPIVYPNPASTQFTVEGENIHKLSLLDPSGRVVREQFPEANRRQHKLSVADLPRGIYLLRVEGPSIEETQFLKITLH